MEQQNILQAEIWLATARFKKINVESNLRKLHQQMFFQVWKWAGVFRKTGKNIGVDVYRISVELKNLCDDVDTWIEYSTYPADEIAVRFHHRLVFIHLFSNGNGQHARFATDILLSKQLKCETFIWGSEMASTGVIVRNHYITALRNADQGNYQFLLEFVRK